MLDVALARKLIERVTKYTSYNVNIMDEKAGIRNVSEVSMRLPIRFFMAKKTLSTSSLMMSIRECCGGSIW